MIVSVTVTNSREREIGDAIRSVVDHVDRVLLIDTGIADETIARAEAIAGQKIVCAKHDWIDFAAARNFGLDTARSLGATWIVIVDSDERLNIAGNLRNTLADTPAHVDVLRIEHVDGFYSKEKIIRAASDAEFFGPTHEALLCSGERTTLANATFDELPKTQEQLRRKFERDFELLFDYVEKHPEDPRWWYYLGATYEGLGDLRRAAIAFGECTSRRRFGVEAAWSAYKQAEMLFNMGLFEPAIAAAARGIGADATFAECAWIAATASFRLGRNDQATTWAKFAEAAGRYKGHGQERAWFRYLPALYELPYDVLRYTLQGEGRAQADKDFHAAKRARLGVASDRDLELLSITRGAPGRFEAREMLEPPKLEALCPSVRARKIQFTPPNGYWPTNPCVVLHHGELWCIVRTVNYTITGRHYEINDLERIVRTENYLGRLSLGGAFRDPRLMQDLDSSPRQHSQIVGYEDIRLVSIDGKLAGSATVCDRDASRRQIARLYFDADGNIECAHVQPSNQTHEKNWMPLEINGELAWIYSLDPTAILPGPLRTCPFALEHLRGGAVVRYDGGYLCVVHETQDRHEGRIYLHRFVWLDEEFDVRAVSPSWIFAHRGIEFCPGMVLSSDRLILSYGIRDQEAWITEVDTREIENMEWFEP